MSNRSLCPLGGPPIFHSISDVETNTQVVIAVFALLFPKAGRASWEKPCALEPYLLGNLYVVYGPADNRP